MALLLVFFTLDLAKDRMADDEDDEDDCQAVEKPQTAVANTHATSESAVAPPIEVTPIVAIESVEVFDEAAEGEPVEETEEQAIEQTENTQIEEQTVSQEPATADTQEDTQVLAQEQETTSQALMRGIATVLPQEDETGEMGIRYDRSFTAKLIQSDDRLKEWYNDIKNHLLSYKKVKDRMSWGRESFRIGKECVARLVIKGKTLCVLLAIIPSSCDDTKYKIEDVEDTQSCKDTPCLYRIKSSRRVNYAKELIDLILHEYDAHLVSNREAVDYYLPYEGTLDLIKRGLIKRRIVAKDKDFLTQITSSNEEGGGIGVA